MNNILDELTAALVAEQSEDPRGIAELALRAVQRAGFALVKLPPMTNARTVKTHRGQVLRVTFGELDVILLPGQDGWWMEHQTTGQTLYDTDPNAGGWDYVAALAWVRRELADRD